MAEKLRTGWASVVRGNVLAMGVVSFFTDAASEMVYPLLPVFFSGLVPVAAAAFYIGLMEGAAECTASILKIIVGRWSDKAGARKPVAVAGYALSNVVRPFVAFASAGLHLVALRFFDRVGKGFRTAPRDCLIGDSADPRLRGAAFGFHRAMDHLGAIVGPLAAIIILFAFLGRGLWAGGEGAATGDEMRALRWVFAISIVPGILAIAAVIYAVREIKPALDDRACAEKPRASGPLPRRFYYFLAAVTLFALGNSSDLFILFYAKTVCGLGLAGVIGVWVALHFAKVIFSVPGGLLSDRLGRKAAIISGWAVYAAVYAGFANFSSPGFIWFLVAAYGVYYGLTEGAEKALVADVVPSASRGTAFGWYHAAVGIAALPASLLFGVFYNVLGPEIAFSIGAGLAAAAGVALLFVKFPRPAASGAD